MSTDGMDQARAAMPASRRIRGAALAYGTEDNSFITGAAYTINY